MCGTNKERDGQRVDAGMDSVGSIFQIEHGVMLVKLGAIQIIVIMIGAVLMLNGVLQSHIIEIEVNIN